MPSAWRPAGEETRRSIDASIPSIAVFGWSERQRYCGENTFGAMPTGSGSVSVRLRVMAASFCDNMGDVSLWGECFSQ